MTDEATFLKAIAANPSPWERQVFADWLEERGDQRAVILRDIEGWLTQPHAEFPKNCTSVLAIWTDEGELPNWSPYLGDMLQSMLPLWHDINPTFGYCNVSRTIAILRGYAMKYWSSPETEHELRQLSATLFRYFETQSYSNTSKVRVGRWVADAAARAIQYYSKLTKENGNDGNIVRDSIASVIACADVLDVQADTPNHHLSKQERFLQLRYLEHKWFCQNSIWTDVGHALKYPSDFI